jgi:hypothetical protein
VLITSSVGVVAPFTKLTDPSERVAYTLDAIGHWLSVSPQPKLVLCDGSNFDFRPVVARAFPGAGIECLRFANNTERVRSCGKGYGEGEIVRYALLNSTVLARSRFFAKCTGKFWVDNFAECAGDWNGTFRCTGNFAGVESPEALELVSINTDFYIVDRAWYVTHFASAYLDVRDREGRYLEHCFRDAVLQANMRDIFFRVYPLVFGVSGSERVRVFVDDKREAQAAYAAMLQQVRRHPRFQHL